MALERSPWAIPAEIDTTPELNEISAVYRTWRTQAAEIHNREGVEDEKFVLSRRVIHLVNVLEGRAEARP